MGVPLNHPFSQVVFFGFSIHKPSILGYPPFLGPPALGVRGPTEVRKASEKRCKAMVLAANKDGHIMIVDDG